ncbi:MAG: transporter substrate-binding domain-containing protein [Bdellovibrio sp.]|nr:transporter substrate-binding domain-containing protein [Bdellovibrio sp.]
MRLFWIYFLYVIVCVQAYAKPVVLATFPIPLMVENEEKGLFIKLVKEIARREKIDLKIVLHPPGKAHLAFSNGKVDGLFPALEGHTPVNSAKSVEYYRKVGFVFYRQDLVLKSLKDLEGKKVGLTFRYNYGEELRENKKIRFEYAKDDVLNMQKLGKKMIDAFVVEERSGLKALQLSGEKNIRFDKKVPIFATPVFFAFQGNSEGKVLAATFSKAIEAMREDGSLEKTLREE